VREWPPSRRHRKKDTIGWTYMARPGAFASGVAFFLDKMRGSVIDTLRLDRYSLNLLST
jgi:hypothetical protein